MAKLEKDLDNAWELLQFVAFLLVIPGLLIWLWYLIFRAPIVEKVVYILSAWVVGTAFGFIPSLW